MSACGRVRAKLGAYLRGQLDERGKQEVESHCAACLPCASALKAQRVLVEAVIPLGRSLEPAPAKLRDALGVCMDCMDNPSRAICRRLKHRLRLAAGPASGVSFASEENSHGIEH
ncbi:MAG: zf-HC2 domain-containing protein [Acidobacteriota bacterium]